MKAETNQFTSNNETFSISTYNGFSILIRDKDGFVNATKLVNDINEKESITKRLDNITRSPEFIALEKEILAENVSPQFEVLTLHYILDISLNINVKGAYVHRESLTII
jgi:hypothetical protein